MKTIEEMSTEEMLSLSDEEQARVFLHGIDYPDGDKKTEDSPDLSGKEPEPEEKEEPVILAKDSKNTIPYSELERARERERAADLRAKELEESLKSKDQLIADLKAAKAADAGTGDTKEQEKVLEEYAGEFPEFMQDIKPYLESMIKQGVAVGIKSFKEEIVKEIEPVKQKVAQSEQQAIEADRNSWIKAQDDFFKAPENQVFKETPALYDYLDGAVKIVARDNQSLAHSDILTKAKEMVTAAIETMQGALGKKPVVEDVKKESAEDIKKKAEDVISKTKETPPFSLSDVPGSAAAHHDEADALANMSTTATMDKFLSLNPDKIEEMLSRLV